MKQPTHTVTDYPMYGKAVRLQSLYSLKVICNGLVSYELVPKDSVTERVFDDH